VVSVVHALDRRLTSARRGTGPELAGSAPPAAIVLRDLPLIAIEVPLSCALQAARKIFEVPGEVLGLWPGVEWVRPEEAGFRVRQRLELPFWEAHVLEFVVRIETAPRDRRQRHAIWKTEGWFFDRAMLWKLHTSGSRIALDLASQHALSAERLEEAVNAYRSRTIWPMRHDSDAILERLTTSFIHDHLVGLDRVYVERVRAWLTAPAPRTSRSRPRQDPPATIRARLRARDDG
jgi:hypothetical protein